MPRTENILVMQSGGPKPVINRSLWGVVDEAAKARAFGRLYGARHALEGLLAGHLTELDRPSKTELGRLSRTPGAALGSSRRKLRPEETPAVFEARSTTRLPQRSSLPYWRPR